jgi:hypothetical protein
MSRVVVFTHLTLDSVMQAPSRADEDHRGGLQHGGWEPPYNDAVMVSVAGEGMAGAGGLLLGRRTYEDFASFWSAQADNPFTEVLDYTQKSSLPRRWRSRFRGGIPRFSRGTLRRPWPGSRSSRARISWSWAADSWSNR